MISVCKRRARFQRLRRQQVGVVLLLIVLALLVVGGTLVLAGIGTGLNKGASSKQALTGNLTLQDLKQVLIGYVVAPPSSDRRPGTLPTPDSLANGNYNGEEDITCLGVGVNGMPAAGSTTPAKRCLGKLPWRKLGVETANADAHDPNGSVPWLAISANLHFDGQCLWVLNSDTLKLDSPMTETCPSPSAPYPQPTSLPHPWLTVVDENGNVLSNRVAAVVILPGGPIQTESRLQSRTVASPGNPSDYLDDIKLPLGCTSACMTRDNAGLTNTFVNISPGAKYPATAQNAALRGELIPFNDQLAFITIDELAPYIERRVNSVATSALTDVKTKTGKWPWLTPFSSAPSTTTARTSEPNTYFGLLPFVTKGSSSGASTFSSDFSWSLISFTENFSETCRKIHNGSPDIYIKPPLRNAIAAPLVTPNLANFSVPNSHGNCIWHGIDRVECKSDTPLPVVTTIATVTAYSNGSCTTANGTAEISIARQVTSYWLDIYCDTPTQSYLAATGTDTQRWSWTCGSVKSTSTVVLEATDIISNVTGGMYAYSQLPRTFSTALTVPGGTKQATLSSMKYHPVLPAWFHENLWYQTTFAAFAPDVAPANSLPCGVTPKLTVNGNDNVDVAVIQAGKNIGMNTRPSASLADYLEGANVTGKTGTVPGMTNCSFSSATTSPAAALNDQITTILP